MNTNAVETLVGTVVIAVAAAFLYYAYGITGAGRGSAGYHVNANFDRVDGISVGTDVRIAGIKIGSVIDQTLDSKTYLAHLVLAIEPQVPIPEDSSVKVALDGLLGGAYLAIIPGGSPSVLRDGGELVNTQPSIDVVGLLGQAIFSPSSGQGGNKSEAAPAPEKSAP